jgi:hypothetical protein
VGGVMESDCIKDILYYCGAKTNHKGTTVLHNGDVLYEHYFKSVKTGDTIILASCSDSKEIKSNYYKKVYDDILDATDEFTILWKFTGKGVKSLDISYEKIKLYYDFLVNEGLSDNNISAIMLDNFVGFKKIKPEKSIIINCNNLEKKLKI